MENWSAMFNGSGTMVSHDGARYEGEWQDGLPDGQGTLLRPDLPPFTGLWKHGCFRDGDRRTSFGVASSSCPDIGASAGP
jgi:hypothetical protein